MTKPALPASTRQKTTRTKASRSTSATIGSNRANASRQRRRPRGNTEKSDVLVSAVLSTYLLTHLHQVLQRAEFGANQEGRDSQAANYAQLRKVLCMDARSMEDASAEGLREADLDQVSLEQAA